MINKILIFISILFLPSLSFATNYCNDASIVGCWLFEDGTGTTISDSSVNSITGTFTDATNPIWRPMSGSGAPTYATYMLKFDGTDDYVDFGLNHLLDYTTGNFTVVTWVYLDILGGSILAKGSYGDYGYFFGTDFDGYLGLYTQQTGTTVSAPLMTNRWYHLAFVRNGTSPNKIYVNGVEGSYSAQANGIDGLQVNYHFNLGNRVNSQPSPIKGKMYQTAVFSRALNSTEINEIKDSCLTGTCVKVTAPANTPYKHLIFR